MAVFSMRRRRAIAPFILGFWLFAICVSVAHACGLDEDFRNAGVSKTSLVSALCALDESATPACEKFCFDDSPLLAKLTAVQDSPTGQAFIVPAPVGGSIQTVTAPPPLLWLSPDPPPGIAVNIRFVRLAL